MKKYDYYERKINYYETDKMAVVHHSNYAKYLEECRVDLMEKYGTPLEYYEKMGYMIPVVELHEKFIESARFGDTIKIVPSFTRVTAFKFEITYKIYNEDMSKVIHEASSVHCFIDKNYKPVSMKKEKPKLYEILLSMKE